MVLRKKKDFSAAYQKRAERIQSIDHHGITPYLKRFQESAKINAVSEDTHRRRFNAIKKFILWCDERELNQPQDITRPRPLQTIRRDGISVSTSRWSGSVDGI